MHLPVRPWLSELFVPHQGRARRMGHSTCPGPWLKILSGNESGNAIENTSKTQHRPSRESGENPITSKLLHAVAAWHCI